MKRIYFAFLVTISSFSSFAFPSWIGNFSATQSGSSQIVTFYVEMNQDYFGLNAEVVVNEGGTWITHALNYSGNNGNSKWSSNVSLKTNATSFYFRGFDCCNSIYLSNGGSNYSLVVNPTTAADGFWNTGSTWCDGSVPSSTFVSYVIAHNVTLDKNVTVGSLTINSGKSFTSSDATQRTLTISKSASGSSTTLSNSGTWSNGTGGSTVVFTGAPSSGDAVHAISGTIPFQNITVNKTGGSSNVGVSFGANSSVSGTLEIGSGGFVSTAPPANFYGANAILKFNQGAGATYDVYGSDYTWSITEVPQNITISSGSVNLNDSRTATGDLIIDGGTLNVMAGKALTVGGTLDNSVASGIILKSPANNGAPGSLITNGSITGSGTLKAERYIPAYTSNLDGWHLISSPVNNPALSSTNLTPGATDDFYKWDETQNLWLNQKVGTNNITSMTTGTGYLVAYASASPTRYMTGTPNNSDVSYSNLTITPATPVEHRGWHLVGNPFPCAIIWNPTGNSYLISNIAGVAKIMGDAGAYSDVNPGGIIPAMQGFSVQATNTTNSFIIPKTARTHNTTSWTKSSEANGILVTANDLESQMVQESWIRINDQATEGYDQEFDSHFLPLYAPQFYSKVGDEMLSTNSLPSLPAESIIPFGFVKNESTQFSIELKQNIDGFTPYLKDLKTNTVQNLSENPVYTFTSEAGDDPNRFELSFLAPTGLDKTFTKSSLRVYTTTGKINISGMDGKAEVLVRNMMGQVVLRNSVNGEKLYSVNSANLPAGVYVISVVSGRQTVSEKVVVK